MVDKSEKFRWLIRLGYAARGLVYILIGYLALSASGGENGPRAAFEWLQDVPLGRPILYLASLGLLAYALYRFCSLLFDVENYGTGREGIAQRIGHTASGVAHLVLAYAAFQFAQGNSQSASGGGGAEAAAAGTVLAVPFGPVILGLIGIGFVAAGAMQGRSAATASFMSRISNRAPPVVEYLGRGGYAARAVVFLIIAWSLVQSAWFASTAEVKTLGEAVNSLADQGTLYTLVAIGLLLFGVFSLFLARYQVIPDVDGRRIRPLSR